MDKKIIFNKESIRKIPNFKSTWHRMRELVIISLNILYIKDALQQCERMRAKAQYLNFPDGPLQVMEDDYRLRKRFLNKRMKVLLEDLMNSHRTQSEYAFNIDLEHACLTKKQLDKGYAIFNNIRDNTYALNLRNGGLLPITNYEENVIDNNLSSLEYTAHHEGSVLKYFDIDASDPLPTENIRY